MALVLNEEQQMLKNSARELLKEKAPVEALRKLRDTNDSLGYDQDLWKEMAEMGWTSLIIPEEYEGLNFGYVGLGQVLEEAGRTLTASPLISTALFASSAIQIGGSDILKEECFKEIMSGAVYALAHEEGSHHNMPVETIAIKKGDSIVLSGTKTFVLDGHVADKLVVSARMEEKVSFYLIDAKAEGVSVERVIMMDSRNSANVTFSEVEVIEQLEGGLATIEKTLDIGRIGLSAEMLGIASEAFDRTVAYLIERKQFGVAIGSFQALQHRAAKMFCEIELLKSIVLKGLNAIDEDSKDLPRLASLAKAKAGETVKLVTNEGVQMFGGIGMTDDEEIGFFLKRARAIQVTLGDANYHLDRLAKLGGY